MKIELLPVPIISRGKQIVFGFINMLVPGLGLFIASVLEEPFHGDYAIVALMQFLLAFLFVGWVWAFVNGLVMMCFPGYHTQPKIVVGPVVQVIQAPQAVVVNDTVEVHQEPAVVVAKPVQHAVVA